MVTLYDFNWAVKSRRSTRNLFMNFGMLWFFIDLDFTNWCIFCLVYIKEFLHFKLKIFNILAINNLNFVLSPLLQLLIVTLFAPIPCINKKHTGIIFHMPKAPTNYLIDLPDCWLFVPLFSRKLIILVSLTFIQLINF